MPDANQFTVTHKELVEMIIKEAGIHEGRWVLMLNFGITAGILGVTEDTAGPGAMIVVSNIGIQREAPGGPPVMHSLVVDAAEVNPKKPTPST